MFLQISLPDGDLIADYAVVTTLVRGVQSLVLVKIARIAKSAVAPCTTQWLVTGMRADVNPQSVFPGVHVVAVHAFVALFARQLADVADDLLHFQRVHLVEARP